MRHETHPIEQLGKQTQSGNEIMPFSVLQKNIYITKFYKKCDLETSSRLFLIFKESSAKKEPEEVSLLIWANFDKFAITYLI